MRNAERNRYATTSEEQHNFLPVFGDAKVAFELRAKLVVWAIRQASIGKF
jgi:hypothetical protein